MVVLPGGCTAPRAARSRPARAIRSTAGLHAMVCHYHLPGYPLGPARRAARRAARALPRRGVGRRRVARGRARASAPAATWRASPTSPRRRRRRVGDPVAPAVLRVNALRPPPLISTVPSGHGRFLRNLLGDSPEPALRARLSLETTVTAANPVTFNWHTADDAAVPVANSLLYAQALADAKVPFAPCTSTPAPRARHRAGARLPRHGPHYGPACEACAAVLGWRVEGARRGPARKPWEPGARRSPPSAAWALAQARLERLGARLGRPRRAPARAACLPAVAGRETHLPHLCRLADLLAPGIDRRQFSAAAAGSVGRIAASRRRNGRDDPGRRRRGAGARRAKAIR